MLFNLLAENRQLTVSQYSKVMKYLQERRELQRRFEGTMEEEVDEDVPDKQAELQNRIMNILNKTNGSPKPVGPPVSTGGPAPLLNDPSVQKALDSLMAGDMFKNMNAA